MSNDEALNRAKLIAQQEEILQQARLDKQLKLKALIREREAAMVTDVDEENEEDSTYTVDLEQDNDTKVFIVQEKKEHKDG